MFHGEVKKRASSRYPQLRLQKLQEQRLPPKKGTKDLLLFLFLLLLKIELMMKLLVLLVFFPI